MFDALQISAKVLIIGVIAVVAIVASLPVWRADSDLKQLISPTRAVDGSV